MKAHVIAAVCLVLTSHQLVNAAPVPGERLPLYYDVTTGNVTIDTTNISGGEFVSYSFRQPVVFGEIRFLYENHTPFMDNLFSPVSTGTAIQESSWPGEPLTPGVYSIGNILPAGLTREELTQSYFGETGFLSTPFDRSRFTYGAYGSFDLDPAEFHVFEINYSPSPFPPLNDPSPEPSEEVTWATAAGLLYDPGDGSLFLDTTGPDGGRVFAYRVRLTEDLFRIDEFSPATNQSFSAIAPDSLSEATRIDAGIHNLGTILPPGLDEQGLLGSIESARFVGQPGHGRGALDVAVSGLPMAITIVPEPSTTLLLLVSMAAMFYASRRRHDR